MMIKKGKMSKYAARETEIYYASQIKATQSETPHMK